MTKLSEQADDSYLTPGERDEERLGSVDYDIWLCPNCQLTEKGRYAAWFSGYSDCHRCGHRTMKSTNSTVREATEYSEGEGCTDHHCGSCGYHDSSTYTIARIQKSESSDSSSSSSSSYSSSSDSSSSFGGGSSSDGGAGASW